MNLEYKCFVCNEEIKENQESYNIGKDDQGNFLRRHKKCHPGLPKNLKVRKSQTLEKRHHVKESDKLFNRDKDKRKFKKELDKGHHD